MCGIIGYLGAQSALPILLAGLRRMEHRGYDSAGVGLRRGDRIELHRSVGKIVELERAVADVDASPALGIGHTRWATHGPPSVANAHPHVDAMERIALVHNGIIENHTELRHHLETLGYRFRSETDTEVLAYLIGHAYLENDSDLVGAVRHALRLVRGAYGLAVISATGPLQIVVARLGSPLLIASVSDGVLVASDPTAVIAHSRHVTYLEDGQIARLGLGSDPQIFSADLRPVAMQKVLIDWDDEAAQKGGHPHFMLKEMLEQPEAIQNTLRGRLKPDTGHAVLGGLQDPEQTLRACRLRIVACGSAYHAGLVGKYLIEQYVGIPVTVDLASEARYRPQFDNEGTAVLAISQSGETMDTLLALREASSRGVRTFGIVNVVGSAIARETDMGVYNRAGPEIGVASTKAFLSQVTVLALLTVFLGRQHKMSMEQGIELVQTLATLPEFVRQTLGCREQVQVIAKDIQNSKGMLFLGRGVSAPVAFEGALKLKEIGYIHAEGYAAGEMKHGPIALIEPDFHTMVVCPQDALAAKTKSGIQEIRTRGGPVYAVTNGEDAELEKACAAVIRVPASHPLLFPILATIPLQLLAYEVAVAKGYDPDHPRNLAKAVVVE